MTSTSTSKPPTATAGPRLVPLSAARLVGNGLFRFVYPFLGVVAVDVGLGAGAEGLLITALAVGGMLVPTATRLLLGERDAPRGSAVRGLVALALGTLLLGLAAPPAAALAGGLGIAVALVGMVVLGLAKPLLDVGSMTYVSARIPYAHRGRALSIMELTWAGGLLLLAPAGALAEATSWQVALLLLGGLSLAAVPLLRHWLDDDGATRALLARARAEALAAEPEVDDEQAAVDRQRDRGSMIRFLVIVLLLFAGLELTFGVVGLWLEDVQQVEVGLLGVFTAIGALGELVGSGFVVAVSDRLGKPRTTGIGLVACAAGFAWLGVAPNLPLALLGLAVGLFGSETAIVAAIALASEVDPHRRGIFLGRMVAVSSVSRGLAGAAGPMLLLRSGIGTNTAISAVAALLAVVVLANLVRRNPRLQD